MLTGAIIAVAFGIELAEGVAAMTQDFGFVEFLQPAASRGLSREALVTRPCIR